MKPHVSTKSWDSIATRQIWESLSAVDLAKLDRALAAGGNPNDTRSLNAWSPSATPLSSAIQRGFMPGVARLLEAGAKRHIKNAASPFALAITHPDAAVFEQVLTLFGAPTQLEISQCLTHIFSLGEPANARKIAKKLLGQIVATNTRLDASNSLGVCLGGLGASQASSSVYPDVVELFLSSKLMRPSPFALAHDAEGLGEWGQHLAGRAWKSADEKKALDLLHSLGFPFAQAQECSKTTEATRWLAEQAAIAQANVLSQCSTPAMRRSKPGRL